MGEPDQDEGTEADRKALAATEIGPELEDPSARRLPTPVLLRDDEEGGPDRMLGRVLSGLYKVEERIGEGGMGTVYAARHVHLNKRFAIKVLSPKIAEHKQAIERLRQEAVAASSIDHDNIVDVVSFDVTDDGEVFIVMELLRGENLGDLLERGALPLAQSIHIAYQMCGALHAAHERGIVHRDLKPENVFIVRKAETDFVKILDFGISKVKSAETEQVRMTKTGQLVGTPLYMSPEQAKGEQEVDRRADIYALGVILYEMLTGAPPFEGGNYFQLLWKHGNEEPEPPRKRNPDLSPALEGVVLKALAKDVEARFQTMAEVEAALAAATPDFRPPTPHYLSTPSLTPVPSMTPVATTPSKGRSARLLGVVALALGLVGAVTWAAVGGDRDPDPPGPVSLPENAVGTAQAGAEEDDPDGTEPAESGDDEDVEPSPDGLPRGADTPEDSEPAMVPTRFVSSPSGATVTVDGRSLGQTPLVAPLPAGEEAVAVTFSLDRHRDHVVSVVPVENATVQGRLRPIRRRDPGGDTPVPFKTTF